MTVIITKSSGQFDSVRLNALSLANHLSTLLGSNVETVSVYEQGKKGMEEIFARQNETVILNYESLDLSSSAWHIRTGARKLLFLYQGITPAHNFWKTRPLVSFLSILGQMQLRKSNRLFEHAAAASPFTVLELKNCGFGNPLWLPNFIEEANCDFAKIKHAQEFYELVYVGRIVENKRVDSLIVAISSICEHIDMPIRLTIVGRAKPNSRYEKKINHIISQKQSSKFIIDHLEDVTATELSQIYRRSHLYVSQSNHEGFGRPVLEAIEQGAPALYCPCGGQETVLEGWGCIQKEEYASALLTVLTEEDKRSDLWQKQKKQSANVREVYRSALNQIVQWIQNE